MQRLNTRLGLIGFTIVVLSYAQVLQAQTDDSTDKSLVRATTVTAQINYSQSAPSMDEADELAAGSKKERCAENARVSNEANSATPGNGKTPALKANIAPSGKPSCGATDDSAKPGQQQQPGGAQDAAELAKKLANPIASLISFPIQANFDFGMGTGSGWRMTTNVQPVVPVALNKNLNLISRTIVPIMHQGNVTAPGASQSGLGDTVQSIFFSPNKTEPLIWGAGPVVLIPTATNGSLGSKQLGLGATVVALKQKSGWTVGALWNHIWRVTGGSGRPRVNSDFIQPFLAYSTKDGWTYTINTESTYDWTANHWNVPIHGLISKVVRFGKQPVSFGGGIRCWVTSTPGGPEGCGGRVVVTGIFPKK